MSQTNQKRKALPDIWSGFDASDKSEKENPPKIVVKSGSINPNIWPKNLQMRSINSARVYITKPSQCVLAGSS